MCHRSAKQDILDRESNYDLWEVTEGASLTAFRQVDVILFKNVIHVRS